jgi:hypothetical protein
MEQGEYRTCREIIYRRIIWCFELYAQELGSSTNAETLKSLFEAAYLKHDNLADATRQLANSLLEHTVW